jgi:tRNA pseudouridine38-40 synthase
MNYKLVIQYDGTNYSGWQIQANASSVQAKITEAIKVILKSKVNLIGSGRTDTGVHAVGQTANFRFDSKIDIYRFKHSLNSILPFDISIISMTEAEEDFHARFDAKKRSYFYLMTLNKSPLLYNYSYYYHESIDISLLNKIGTNLLGTHDFRSFSKKNSGIENTVCTVYSSHWRMISGIVVFLIEADRYLHGMVRTITGTLLKLSHEQVGEEKIVNILSGNDRSLAGEALPAKGLFLYKVKY